MFFRAPYRRSSSIKWCDVLDKSELIITEHKTKKIRKITINPKVQETLGYCSNVLTKKGKFRPDKSVFANRWGDPMSTTYINRRLKHVFKQYNIQVQNPSSHTLRKTFGKRIWEADQKSDRSIVMLSEIFNHSSLNVTRKYIGITASQIADVYMSL
jgi:integrase